MLPGKKYTPRDLLAMARRRIWLIVIPPAITTLGALIYATTLTNMYQSDMLIAIVPQRVPDTFVRSTVTMRTEERIDAIGAQVLSRTNLEQMIGEFDLYPTERERLPMEDVVAMMRGNIEFPLERSRPGPRGPEPAHAFHVKFMYSDPNVAAKVTQRLGSLFVDQNARDRGALASATNRFLESQLSEARTRLEEQERRLEAFRERHGNELPTQMQTNLQAIQSMQLQVQAIVESTARDRDRKLMLERLHQDALAEPAIAPPPPQNAGAATVPAAASARQQLELARAALAQAELRLRPEHPDIVRLKRTIADLEPKAAAETANPDETPAVLSPLELQRRTAMQQRLAEIESLERQIQFKESEEKRLRAAVAEYQRRIEAVPGVESEWAVLTRDYETHQASYKELLNKSEAAKLAVDLEDRQIGEQFKILDPAQVPVHPTASIRMQVNALGFGLGLVLGLGIAAFLELRDAAFRSEAEVLDLLSLPVLALVPLVETASERRARRRRQMLVSAAAVVAVAGGAYVFWSMKLWNSLV